MARGGDLGGRQGFDRNLSTMRRTHHVNLRRRPVPRPKACAQPGVWRGFFFGLLRKISGAGAHLGSAFLIVGAGGAAEALH